MLGKKAFIPPNFFKAHARFSSACIQAFQAHMHANQLLTAPRAEPVTCLERKRVSFMKAPTVFC